MIKMEEKIWEVENLLDIESCFQEVTEANAGINLSVWEVNDLDSEGFDNVSILSGYPFTEFLFLSWSDDNFDLADFWYETPEFTTPAMTVESILSQYTATPEDKDLLDYYIIPAPADEIFKKNKEKSWNSIVEEIESTASESIFDYNMSDLPTIPDMLKDFSHSSIRLVKGNKQKTSVNRMLRKLDNEQPATFDIFAYDETHELPSAAKPEYNIPLRVSFENGNMVFRLDLSSVEMLDLNVSETLPAFSKAIAYIPRTKHFEASLDDEELRLVVPRFRSKHRKAI